MPRMLYVGSDGKNGLTKGDQYYISASNVGYTDTVKVKVKENMWDKYCYEIRYNSWRSFYKDWRS